jgi:hypothetical protein
MSNLSRLGTKTQAVLAAQQHVPLIGDSSEALESGSGRLTSRLQSIMYPILLAFVEI